jgi:hypothetical protein
MSEEWKERRNEERISRKRKKERKQRRDERQKQMTAIEARHGGTRLHVSPCEGSAMMIKCSRSQLVEGAHACHCSYSVGRDQNDWGSIPAQANSLQDTMLKLSNTIMVCWSDSSDRAWASMHESWVQIPLPPKKWSVQEQSGLHRETMSEIYMYIKLVI